MPFTRALVKVKPYRVAEAGVTTIDLAVDTAPHLAPEELHRWIEDGKEMIILDTRNDYEYEVGKFQKLSTKINNSGFFLQECRI